MLFDQLIFVCKEFFFFNFDYYKIQILYDVICNKNVYEILDIKLIIYFNINKIQYFIIIIMSISRNMFMEFELKMHTY